MRNGLIPARRDFRTRLDEIKAEKERQSELKSDELDAMQHGMCPRCMSESVKASCNIYGLRRYACKCGHNMAESPFPGI